MSSEANRFKKIRSNILTLNEIEKLRTKEGPIRTVSRIPMQVKIPCHQTLPIYKVLAPRVKELKKLGLSNNEIARRLNQLH